MKNLILFLAIIFLAACDGDDKNSTRIITYKGYTDSWGNPILPGICRYYYKHSQGYCAGHPFEDSCFKYNMFDTLK